MAVVATAIAIVAGVVAAAVREAEAIAEGTAATVVAADAEDGKNSTQDLVPSCQ